MRMEDERGGGQGGSKGARAFGDGVENSGKGAPATCAPHFDWRRVLEVTALELHKIYAGYAAGSPCTGNKSWVHKK